jgi:AP-4 complex subunit sigma-1
VLYRRYASLYFIIGIDNDDEVNELSYLEFIHNLVETLDKYFENVVSTQSSLTHTPYSANWT